MDPGETGLLILITISVLVAIALLSKLRRRPILTIILSGPIATVLFITAAAIRQGYLDPFFPIALVVGSVIASAVAACVVGVAYVINKMRGLPH